MIKSTNNATQVPKNPRSTRSTPRQFRNALYAHLTDHSVSEDIATRIVTEAELYANAYDAYKLRGIESAAAVMGLQRQLRPKQSPTKLTKHGSGD